MTTAIVLLNAPASKKIAQNVLNIHLDKMKKGEIKERGERHYIVKLDDSNLLIMHMSPENKKIWENYDKIELLSGALRFKKGTNINHSLARAYQKNGDYKSMEEAYLTIYKKK